VRILALNGSNGAELYANLTLIYSQNLSKFDGKLDIRSHKSLIFPEDPSRWIFINLLYTRRPYRRHEQRWGKMFKDFDFTPGSNVFFPSHSDVSVTAVPLYRDARDVCGFLFFTSPAMA